MKVMQFANYFFLVRPSFVLNRRIDDFHCPVCLSWLSIGRWDWLLGDFHCLVCPIMF